MNGSAGNQKEAMFFTGQRLDEALGFHWLSILLALLQRRAKRRRVNILLKPKKHFRPGLGIQDIVCLILGEVFAKMLANIGEARVALHGEVAAIESIEKVKPDGKLLPESIGVIAQDRPGFMRHQ